MAKDLLENIGDTCNRMFKRGKVRISEAEYTFNKCALLTISFWLCQSTLQTASGFVGKIYTLTYYFLHTINIIMNLTSLNLSRT